MFERYTEKARRVIFYSRYEAAEFGSPYIESEFLLLGILRENKDAMRRWLGEGDWRTILHEEVARHVDVGPKRPTSVDLPLSNESKLVLAYATEEAQLLSHDLIGVDHLFLGLMRDPKSRVAKLLIDRGVDPNTVRKALIEEGAESGSADRGLAAQSSISDCRRAGGRRYTAAALVALAYSSSWGGSFGRSRSG